MGKSITIFLASLLVIALLASTAFTGLDLVVMPAIPPVEEGVVLGLDLKGGAAIVFEANESEINPDTLAHDMNTAVGLLRRRLDELGYNEASISKEGERRVRVEIPGLTDTAEAVETIGSTAKLEFKDSTGKVWLTGDEVESATMKFDKVEQMDLTAQNLVALEFSKEGGEKFAEATKFAAQQTEGENYIEVSLDGKSVSQPMVDSKFAANGIDGGSCVVTFGTGSDSSQSAKDFAALVTAGRLPFSLIEVGTSVVGPTLGENALNSSLIAGLIGLILIMIFMIAVYRLPGVVASISLAFYTALFAVFLSAAPALFNALSINLTLPGIAGIILSVAMAVDANVIIFERIKDELRSGKTVSASVEAGFKRSMPAIADSNITTLIVASVLWYFGTGPVQGFARVLFIGVIISMFTALVVSRFLLKQLVGLGLTSPAMYGVSAKHIGEISSVGSYMEEKTYSFNKRLPRNIIPAAVICLAAVVCLVILPFNSSLKFDVFNLDIDFLGGSTLQYDLKDPEADLDEVSGILEEHTGVAPAAPQRANETGVLLKTTAEVHAAERAKIFAGIQEKYPDAEVISEELVGSSVGEALRNSAILAVIFSLFGILLYITMRFQFSSGVAAIVGLTHDVLIVIAAYAILRIPVNMNTIAVLLTILAYSLNDSVVVFDRVRENRRLLQKAPFGDVVDRSIWQTIMRNINTSLTTLFPLICVIVLGVATVREFSIPLTVGILAGALSSIYLAGPMWVRIGSIDNKATEKMKERSKA